MTITSQTNKAQALGNGSIVDFTFGFPIPDEQSAQVYLGDALQSSGYTIAGLGSDAGGTVTFTAAPADGVLVTILRVVPLTQQVDYQPYDAFPAETHENALDKLTMITQQIQEELDRSWKVPVDTPPGADVAPPAYEAGKVLAWSDTEANRLVNQPGIGTFTQLADDAAADAAAADLASQQANNAASSAAASAQAADVAKLIWRGAWDSATTYRPNDAVSLGGSSYIATEFNTNEDPPNHAGSWDVLAEAGSSGPGGGDVIGPGASTDGYLVQWQGTAGINVKQGIPTSTFATPADVASAVAGKADTTYVDEALAGKADVNYVNAEVATRTPYEYVQDIESALRDEIEEAVESAKTVPVSTTTSTLVVGDKGKCVSLGAGVTVPASVFAAGDVVSLYNNTAGNLTVTQGSGLTLRQVGTANTGNRTLAQRGMATIWFLSASEAIISGGGLS